MSSSSRSNQESPNAPASPSTPSSSLPHSNSMSSANVLLRMFHQSPSNSSRPQSTQIHHRPSSTRENDHNNDNNNNNSMSTSLPGILRSLQSRGGGRPSTSSTQQMHSTNSFSSSTQHHQQQNDQQQQQSKTSNTSRPASPGMAGIMSRSLAASRRGNNNNISGGDDSGSTSLTAGGKSGFQDSIMDLMVGVDGSAISNQDVTAGIVPDYNNMLSGEGSGAGSGGGADDHQQGPSVLDTMSPEKLSKLKRGLWFIIRGQKINSMDGIGEFFEQVKEEMTRQQLRDESSRAGGTATLVENMMTSFQTSSFSPQASMSSAISTSTMSDAGSPLGVKVKASSAPQTPPPSSFPQQQQQVGDMNSLVHETTSSVLRDSDLLPANQDLNKDLRKQEEEAALVFVKSSTAAGGSGGGDPKSSSANLHNFNNSSSHSSFRKSGSIANSRVLQQQANANSVILAGLTFEQAKKSGRLRPKVILKSIPETEEQMQQSRITDFIEEWQDTVSLFIILSQLFVLYSVFFHAGFNVPVSVASIVLDKLFGDLVAIISTIFRCIAPFKEHGRWHFDRSTKFSRYFWSGALIVDVIGVFPLDLVGYGLGYNCALWNDDRCGVVDGLFQMNRLLQCRGMLTNFGAVAETLFLRRGLHPILGRCAEVLLALICLTHIVACSFNFLLSRDDRATLYEFFDANFDTKPLDFQYFLVLDWATKSLVGLSPRGTSYPPKALDQAFLICLTIVGVAIFTNYIATIKLYFDRDCPEKTHYQLLDETIDMVNYMDLDDGFRDDCLAYFNHMFSARFHVNGMKDFEDDLTSGLARKMRFVVGRELVQHIPLLKSLQHNEPFIVSLMQRIEPLVLPPDTTIFKRDDSGSTMLVIIKGFVNILNPKDDKTVVATLGPGKVVGEVALLMDSPRTATVVSCNEFLNVLSLDRRQMSELIMLFPEIAPILMAEMATRMHQLNQQKQQQQKDQQQQKE